MNTLPPPDEEQIHGEADDAYQRWFRAKVQASLNSPHPSSPHAEVMERMREALQKKRDAHVADNLEP